MTKSEFEALKARIRDQRERATDLDVLVAKIMELPYGQLKKVLTDEVLEILAKYGYGEEG